MKLTAILVSLLTSVMGQNILIRAPVDDTTVSPNSTFIVQVDKPVSLIIDTQRDARSSLLYIELSFSLHGCLYCYRDGEL